MPNREIEIEKKWLQLSLMNSDEFVRFYDKYSDRVYRFALVRTSSIEAAQDITSEAFAVALEKLSEFQWRGFTFGAWLFKIAVQLVYRSNRQTHRMTELDLIDPQEIVEKRECALTRLVRTEAERALIECLEKLDEQARTIMDLYYWGDLKVKEIAVVLGIPQGTVQSHLLRDREQLRGMLEEM